MLWIINSFLGAFGGGGASFYQAQVPGRSYVNDSDTNQMQVPGGFFVDEA